MMAHNKKPKRKRGRKEHSFGDIKITETWDIDSTGEPVGSLSITCPREKELQAYMLACELQIAKIDKTI